MRNSKIASVTTLLTLLIPCHLAQASEQLACHINYGGEDQILTAKPGASPYAEAPTAVGSYFLFRIAFETTPRELAAIKLYTYANRDDAPVPIHIASYPYPVASKAGKYGFTGLQTVYEPLRDGELKYWCEISWQKGKK